MFLAGLNHYLDEVSGRILGINPLSSLDEVFAQVRTTEEGRRKIILSEKTSSVSETSSLFNKNFPIAPQN